MGAQLTPTPVVLDSWPLLEWIKRREPARTRFNRLLDAAERGELLLIMSRINYGEVIYSIRKAPDITDVSEALRELGTAPLHLHTIDDALVDAAVELKSRYPFSFADAFGAALAIRLGAPLATGDPEFRALESAGLLTLQWLGV